MVLVDEDEFNQIKSELAGSRRVLQEMVDTVQLWKDKCKALEVDNNRLKVDNQCLSIARANTPPTSTSLTSHPIMSVEGCKSGSKMASRKQLGAELSSMNVPHSLVSHFQSFLDSMTTFAHEYTSELCRSSWNTFQSSIDWAPNEVVSDERLLRDWRGRVVQKADHRSVTFPSSEHVSSVGAPLLDIVKINDSDEVTVQAAFFPLCPFEESRRGSMFTSTSDTMINFMFQAVASLVFQTLQETLGKNVLDSIFSFLSKGCVLRSRFALQCKQVMSTRKRYARDAFFNNLGYKYIVAVRPKDAPDDFDVLRAEEQASAYARLYKEHTDGTRDTSYWRRASFEDICHVDVLYKPPISNASGVDNIFGNEPSRRAYIFFRKHAIVAMSETSCMTIIRLDAVMTGIIDSFKGSVICELETPAANCNNDAHLRDGSNVPTTLRRQRKGGRLPLDSVRRLNGLLPTAAAQFLREAHDLFWNQISGDIHDIDRELNVKRDGSEQTRLNNKNRQHTIAFRYPSNGHYYIALSQFAFSEVVCDWIGKVSDCYILHSQTLELEFKVFEDSDVFDLLDERDEIVPDEQTPRLEVDDYVGGGTPAWSDVDDDGDMADEHDERDCEEYYHHDDGDAESL